MKIGYARTSTLEQEAGLEAQIRDLKAMECGKIFSEQTSSIGERMELEAALDFVREGDTLIVVKLDRLARSVTHLGQIVEALDKKKANLQILDLGINTAQATGKLVLNVMGAIAQFERETMLERQREGIAKAKADGKYRGRAPTAQQKAGEVRRLAKEGLAPAEIARRLEIGRSSVYRLL
ncbi:MAG: recombinase family protein [Alphaproteobacteria bacterium PRO2]|nr:recombinase family protein [Alphaproteobacteria bacterium PRO2]